MPSILLGSELVAEKICLGPEPKGIWSMKGARSQPAPKARVQAWIRTGLICGGMMLSAGIGYELGTAGKEPVFVLGLQQPIPSEAYQCEPTFSEIDEAQGRLKAVCLEFLGDVRARHDLSASTLPSASFKRSHSFALNPQGAIDELFWGLEQFRGTGPELMVVQELLILLKRQDEGDRWLDVYLSTLYRYPTHALIARYAKDAAEISRNRQRGAEVEEAQAFLKRVRDLREARLHRSTQMKPCGNAPDAAMNVDANPG